jgi:thioesterase domain-containing protein
MMASPNVEALGRTLSGAIRTATEAPKKLPESDDSPLVNLQSRRHNAPPLFCIPGAGANVTSFIELVSCLEAARPIYGLQPRGLDGALVPHSTVQAASQAYLRSIGELHPTGTVHLLGHSFGGWVALEMARRLLEAGRTVGSLTILDSEVPDDEDVITREYNSTEAIMAWLEIFELLLDRPLGVTRAEIGSRNDAAQRELLHRLLVKEGVVPARSSPAVLRGPLRTFAMSLRTHYRPGEVYPGQVRLVLVDDQRLDTETNRKNQEQIVEGWKRWAPNLVYTHAAGNHMTILKSPYVQALASLVRSETRDIGSHLAAKAEKAG